MTKQLFGESEGKRDNNSDDDRRYHGFICLGFAAKGCTTCRFIGTDLAVSGEVGGVVDAVCELSPLISAAGNAPFVLFTL
jgi:hypothetical protein